MMDGNGSTSGVQPGTLAEVVRAVQRLLDEMAASPARQAEVEQLWKALWSPRVRAEMTAALPLALYDTAMGLAVYVAQTQLEVGHDQAQAVVAVSGALLGLAVGVHAMNAMSALSKKSVGDATPDMLREKLDAPGDGA